MRNARSVLSAVSFCLLAGVLPALGCSANAGHAGADSSGGQVACKGESREKLICESEVSYQGANAQGSFGVKSLVSGDAKYEEVALRRVDEATERFVAMHKRICRDYNACILDKDEYVRESRDIRDRIAKVPDMALALKNAKSDDDRKRALDQLYRNTVPDDQRAEEVTFRLAMDAVLPDGRTVEFKPGDALPTGAKVAFYVDVSKDAFVYIFQSSPSTGLAVLFPDQRIGTQNPLHGAQTARIPNGSARFKLNDKDVGMESVYFAVSRTELKSLDSALDKVKSGQVTSLAGDPTLKAFASLQSAAKASGGGAKCRGFELEPSAGDACSKSRGLELDDGAGPAAPTTAPAKPALAVRTDPGDAMIVQTFHFDHMTPGAFAARGGGGPLQGAAPAAPAAESAGAPGGAKGGAAKEAPAKSRGVIMDE